MTPETLLLVVVAILVAVYALVALVAYCRSRWTQLMVPGEADALVARFDAGHTAVRATGAPHPGEPSFGGRSTGRPPAAASPTRREDMLRTWFAGKSCAICNQAIPPIQRGVQHPGLMNFRSQARELVSWDEIPADEHLPAVLESHVPVCANCSLAETFRRKFPELVTERPDQGRAQN